MGRSITTVYQHATWEGKESVASLVCMYRQMDGYPSGHGKELAEFLSGFTIVNGIGVEVAQRIANGGGCLAAQMVAHFKTDVGSIYLESMDERGECDAGQDYEYEVHVTFGEPGIRLVCKDRAHRALFDGTAEGFLVSLGLGEV